MLANQALLAKEGGAATSAGTAAAAAAAPSGSTAPAPAPAAAQAAAPGQAGAGAAAAAGPGPGAAISVLAGVREMHPWLAGALDLVEARGGLDAAYLRFLRLRSAAAAAVAALMAEHAPALAAAAAAPAAAAAAAAAGAKEEEEQDDDEEEAPAAATGARKSARRSSTAKAGRGVTKGGRGRGGAKGGRGGGGAKGKGRAASAEPAAAAAKAAGAGGANSSSAAALDAHPLLRDPALCARLDAALAGVLAAVFDADAAPPANAPANAPPPNALSTACATADLVLQFVDRHVDEGAGSGSGNGAGAAADVDAVALLKRAPVYGRLRAACLDDALDAAGVPSAFAALPAPLRAPALRFRLWREAEAALRGGLAPEQRWELRPVDPLGPGQPLAHAPPAVDYLSAETLDALTARHGLERLEELAAATLGGAPAPRLPADVQRATAGDDHRRAAAHLGAAMARQEELLAALAYEYGGAVVSYCWGSLCPASLSCYPHSDPPSCISLVSRAPMHTMPPPPSQKDHPTASRELPSLLPERLRLGRLPLLAQSLGEAVKAERARAWPVLRALRPLSAPTRIVRWMRRNAPTEAALSAYLAKTTSELRERERSGLSAWGPLGGCCL